MKFDTYLPTECLRPYIKHLAVSEDDAAHAYQVLPSAGLVLGFQYQGHLALLSDNTESTLAAAGITGISQGSKTFKNSAGTGTVLVYFTETGFTHFASQPANELFDLCISLDDIFDKTSVGEARERLELATTDIQRVKIVERFLLAHLKHVQTDKLIAQAVKSIHQSRGTIRVRELTERLCISQSPFEKRFRRAVGTTPKKFASIVRFNAVLADLNSLKSLTEIGYEHHFFDQAHFIKDFRRYTGDTPENFKRLH